MNQVNLSGRLVNENFVEAKTNNTYLLRFRLAIKENVKEINFIDIVTFNKLAENIKKYVHKGDLIEITGKLKLNKYTDAKETKKVNLEVIAEKVVFVVKAKVSETNTEEIDLNASNIQEKASESEDLPEDDKLLIENEKKISNEQNEVLEDKSEANDDKVEGWEW